MSENSCFQQPYQLITFPKIWPKLVRNKVNIFTDIKTMESQYEATG